MSPREPVMSVIGPAWFHNHGTKIKLVKCDIPAGIVRMKSSAVEVEIRRYPAHSGLFIEWDIIHSPTDCVSGTVRMAKTELASAFGLTDEMGRFGDQLINSYGGTVATKGKFIRYDEYLNIPCPGTGHDGDPNVSIMLDDRIKNAVHSLLSTTKK